MINLKSFMESRITECAMRNMNVGCHTVIFIEFIWQLFKPKHTYFDWYKKIFLMYKNIAGILTSLWLLKWLFLTRGKYWAITKNGNFQSDVNQISNANECFNNPTIYWCLPANYFNYFKTLWNCELLMTCASDSRQ